VVSTRPVYLRTRLTSALLNFPLLIDRDRCRVPHAQSATKCRGALSFPQLNHGKDSTAQIPNLHALPWLQLSSRRIADALIEERWRSPEVPYFGRVAGKQDICTYTG